MPGRAYVVGERGPELFVPRVAGTVYPTGKILVQAELAGDLQTRVDLDALIIRLKQRESFRRLG